MSGKKLGFEHLAGPQARTTIRRVSKDYLRRMALFATRRDKVSA